jgi:hypothetical protein
VLGVDRHDSAPTPLSCPWQSAAPPVPAHHVLKLPNLVMEETMGRPPRAVSLEDALSLIDAMQICLLVNGSDWHNPDGRARKWMLDLSRQALAVLMRAGSW